VGKETVTASCSQAHFDFLGQNQLLALGHWLVAFV
jgi:hypothetical protein